jgi:hypothetical protein
MSIMVEEECLRDMQRKCISTRKEDMAMVTGITEDMDVTDENEKK